MTESRTTDRSRALQTLVSPGSVVRLLDSDRPSKLCQDSLSELKPNNVLDTVPRHQVRIRVNPVIDTSPTVANSGKSPSMNLMDSVEAGDESLDKEASIELPLTSGPEAIVRTSRIFGHVEEVLPNIDPGSIQVCIANADRIRRELSQFDRQQLYQSLDRHIQRTDALCHVHDKELAESQGRSDRPLQAVVSEEIDLRNVADPNSQLTRSTSL